ncbi:hypothetical protein GCM10011492_00950 [Flexivirga endophytica]|uniref:Glycosyltransferase 2-like domain-containing protein n=1 Tax=Flexivirga endophytica TaxID=1849103 RepID=A0A916SSN6_9MICO|nr:hypothetical protein GCM10011492_00950 [Flexivirga endophytica]GHB65167.1 hypothetical protein GCM10008112_37540 [Flexivirga endophytica]
MPAGWAPTLPRMILHMSGISRLARINFSLRGHYLLRNQVADEMAVDWVTGACLLTRRDAWNSVGGMTTRWFMYAEDLDYCLRLGDAGWRVVLLGSTEAEHAAGLSSAGNDGRIRTEWIVNLAELYDLHFGRARAKRVAWRAVVASGFLARSAIARSAYDRRRFRAYGHAVARSAKGKR